MTGSIDFYRDVLRKNQYDVFNNRVMNCEKKSLQEWFMKFDEYMEKSLLNFRKGFSIVFNKELEKDIAEIKKLNEKLQELNGEKTETLQAWYRKNGKKCLLWLKIFSPL